MIIEDWRRRSSRKATKSHLQNIPDFSPLSTGLFPVYRRKIRYSVSGCHITGVIHRNFLRIYHNFLRKSSNHLDCAGQPQQHVQAAYVGRPGRPADQEEPFCIEEACRMVGTVLLFELLDFFPVESTDLRELAYLGRASPRYRFQLEGLDPRL